MANIKIIQADITKVEVEAIVNAANRTLLGGGGVDGAIHRVAGPELLKECETLGGCFTGGAKLTAGYNLLAKNIIHTVGPVWRGGNHNEEELLVACYRNSLEVARDNKIKSIAFPAISTGVYRFPKERAARLALKTVKKFIDHNKEIKNIIFVLFTENEVELYKKTYEQIFIN